MEIGTTFLLCRSKTLIINMALKVSLGFSLNVWDSSRTIQLSDADVIIIYHHIRQSNYSTGKTKNDVTFILMYQRSKVEICKNRNGFTDSSDCNKYSPQLVLWHFTVLFIGVIYIMEIDMSARPTFFRRLRNN